jgi:hypothetical protein
MTNLCNWSWIDTDSGLTLAEGQEAIGNKVKRIDSFIPEKVEDLFNRLSPLMFPVKKSEVFNLPPLIEEFVEISPSAELIRQARVMRKQSETVGKLLQNLRRLSEGVMYVDTYDEIKDRKDREYRHLPNQKKEWVIKEYMPDILNGGRGLIFAGYVGSVEGVALEIKNNYPSVEVIRVNGLGWFRIALGRANKLSDTEIKKVLFEFDNSNALDRARTYVIVGHPKSLATGLELSAVNHILWYSGVDDGEAFFQAKERAYSFNRTLPLRSTMLCLLPSDKVIFERLKNKEALTGITFEALSGGAK